MLSPIALLADESLKPWPDGIDFAAIAWYVALAFGVPILGYACMVLDFRAYLVVPEKMSVGRVGMILRCELGRIKRASAGAMFGGTRLRR